MPFEKRQAYKYASISKENHPHGLIRHKDRDGNEYHFGTIKGILTQIELKKDEYQGEERFVYHFKFEDREHTEVNILQIGEAASAARGLLTTLMCCEEPIGWVSVSPYRKEYEGKEYTNVWVEVNGHTVEWKDEVKQKIPDTREVEFGGKIHIDDGKRRKWFRKVAEHISQEKLHGGIYHSAIQPEAKAERAETAGMNGKQQAEALHGDPEPSLSERSSQEDNDTVDMSDLDVDDDLPF